MASELQPRLRVLVVDDEAKLTELLRLELDVEGPTLTSSSTTLTTGSARDEKLKQNETETNFAETEVLL